MASREKTDLDARQSAEPAFERPGHGVRVSSVTEPGAVLQRTHPGRGEETHFGRELSALFPAKREIPREIGIEEDQGFSEGQSILPAAQRKHIDSRFPRDAAQRRAESGGGIREARAIHVQPEIQAARRVPERGDFSRRIDGSEFR